MLIEAAARPGGPSVFRVLSALAEGADRIVARALLTLPGALLDVILPLDESDYVRDFRSPDSRADFKAMLRAARVRLYLSVAGARTIGPSP